MLEFSIAPSDVNFAHSEIDARQVFSSQTSDETIYIIHPLTSKVIEVDPSQLWFWSREWQEDERRVDEELRTGQYEEFDNLDDFINTL